jgi:uncharacterized protein YukE
MNDRSLLDRLAHVGERLSALSAELQELETLDIGGNRNEEIPDFTLSHAAEQLKEMLVERRQTLENQLSATENAITDLAEEFGHAESHFEELSLQIRKSAAEDVVHSLSQHVDHLKAKFHSEAQAMVHNLDDEGHAVGDLAKQFEDTCKSIKTGLTDDINGAWAKVANTFDKTENEIRGLLKTVQDAEGTMNATCHGASTGLEAIAEIVTRTIRLFQQVG